MNPADRQVADVKILQKVNALHREAFSDKYEGQIEHCLRLLCERLQAGLDKRGNVDINDITTWRMTPAELADISQAVHHLHSIRTDLKK
jgi:hypothetical protein